MGCGRRAVGWGVMGLGAGLGDAWTVDWVGVFGCALGGALLAVLSSLASSKVGFPTSASFID